jgi:hypothetical protein
MAAIGAVVQRSGWCPGLAGVRPSNLRQVQLHQMCACCVTSQPAASAEETLLYSRDSPVDEMTSKTLLFHDVQRSNFRFLKLARPRWRHVS